MLSDSFYSSMWCEFWYSSVIITMTLHLILNLRKAEIKAEKSGTNDDAEGWKCLKSLANHTTETITK